MTPRLFNTTADRDAEITINNQMSSCGGTMTTPTRREPLTDHPFANHLRRDACSAGSPDLFC
jgi:hypothetical protein